METATTEGPLALNHIDENRWNKGTEKNGGGGGGEKAQKKPGEQLQPEIRLRSQARRTAATCTEQIAETTVPGETLSNGTCGESEVEISRGLSVLQLTSANELDTKGKRASSNVSRKGDAEES